MYCAKYCTLLYNIFPKHFFLMLMNKMSEKNTIYYARDHVSDKQNIMKASLWMCPVRLHSSVYLFIELHIYLNTPVAFSLLLSLHTIIYPSRIPWITDCFHCTWNDIFPLLWNKTIIFVCNVGFSVIRKRTVITRMYVCKVLQVLQDQGSSLSIWLMPIRIICLKPTHGNAAERIFHSMTQAEFI